MSIFGCHQFTCVFTSVPPVMWSWGTNLNMARLVVSVMMELEQLAHTHFAMNICKMLWHRNWKNFIYAVLPFVFLNLTRTNFNLSLANTLNGWYYPSDIKESRRSVTRSCKQHTLLLFDTFERQDARNSHQFNICWYASKSALRRAEADSQQIFSFHRDGEGGLQWFFARLNIQRYEWDSWLVS